MATRSDEWSESALRTLLRCYSGFVDSSRGATRAKGWVQLVATLNADHGGGGGGFSYRRCKNKMDVMKRRYKHERIKSFATGVPSEWPWYRDMDVIGGGISRPSPLSFRAPPILDNLKNLSGKQQQQNRHQHQESSNARMLLDRVGVLTSPPRSSSSDILLQFQQQRQEGSPPPEEVADDYEDANGSRKRKRCCSSYAKELTRAIVDAFEHMENRKLAQLREFELRRCEMQLQIARMLVSPGGIGMPSAARGAPEIDQTGERYKTVQKFLVDQPMELRFFRS